MSKEVLPSSGVMDVDYIDDKIITRVVLQADDGSFEYAEFEADPRMVQACNELVRGDNLYE